MPPRLTFSSIHPSIHPSIHLSIHLSFPSSITYSSGYLCIHSFISFHSILLFHSLKESKKNIEILESDRRRLDEKCDSHRERAEEFQEQIRQLRVGSLNSGRCRTQNLKQSSFINPILTMPLSSAYPTVSIPNAIHLSRRTVCLTLCILDSTLTVKVFY